jgi:hypothetical protein
MSSYYQNNQNNQGRQSGGRKRGCRGGRGRCDRGQQPMARPEPMSPPPPQVEIEVEVEIPVEIPSHAPVELRLPRVFPQHTTDHIIRAFMQKRLGDVTNVDLVKKDDHIEALLIIEWYPTQQALEVVNQLIEGKEDVKLFHSRNGYWFLQPKYRNIWRGILQPTKEENDTHYLNIIEKANRENMMLRHILESHGIDADAELAEPGAMSRKQAEHDVSVAAMDAKEEKEEATKKEEGEIDEDDDEDDDHIVVVCN